MSAPSPDEVRRMFDRIAPVYDAMNTVMTAGLDGRWRAATIRALRLRPGDVVLDVATGTGRLALAAADRVAPGGSVIGLDASAAMLGRARRAEARHRSGRRVSVRWLEADATAMPLPDASVDAVALGFGLRNLPDPAAGLAELVRVLRPGGRLAVLEIAEPEGRIGRLIHRSWFRRAIPWVGRRIGLGEAYAYLPASLERYPGPAAIAGLMRDAGLVDVRWRRLALGLVTLHRGRRAAERAP